MTISRIIDSFKTYYLFTKALFMFFIDKYIMPKKWYIIEGNIGCGKTTLIRNLKKYDDFEVIEEPVEEWKEIKDENGENILGLFYKDGHKYAYLFQTIVFKSRIRALETEQKEPIRFSERSIWTDKNIFSKNCYEMGLMNSVEKCTYDFWFNWLESKITKMPDGIIYLKASPENCHERMKKRDRAEETSVSLEYLTKIHEKHEEWLNKPKYNDVPIYVIDNNVKPEESLRKVLEIIHLDNKLKVNLKVIYNSVKQFFIYSKIYLYYSFQFLTNKLIIKMNAKDEFILEKSYNLINFYYKCLLFNIWFIDVPIFLYCFLF